MGVLTGAFVGGWLAAVASLNAPSAEPSHSRHAGTEEHDRITSSGSALQPATLAAAWDIFSIIRESFNFYDRRGTIYTAALDPSGRYVALGGRNVGTGSHKYHGDVKLCELRTGKQTDVITVARGVTEMAFNKDGTLLAVCFSSCETDNCKSNMVFCRIGGKGLAVKVHEETVPFYPMEVFDFVDSHFVAAGGGHLIVWRASDWTIKKRIRSHVSAAAVDPASKMVAVAMRTHDFDGISLWTVEGARPTYGGMPGQAPLAFMSGRRLVHSIRKEPGSLGIKRAGSGERRRVLPASKGVWQRCAVSENGESSAAWRKDGTIRVWTLGTNGGEARVVRTLCVPRAREVLFTADEDILVVAVDRHTIMGPRPGGGLKVVGCEREGVELWRISTETLLHRFDAYDFTTRGGYLVAYSSGGEYAFLWNISDPASPKLLWKDQWRSRSRSLIPLLE